MTVKTILLDPTSELKPATMARLPRPQTLKNKTIGLLDISKARGDVFLDALEKLLGSRNIFTKRYKKPTFARVIPTELAQTIATECDLVIEALAD